MYLDAATDGATTTFQPPSPTGTTTVVVVIYTALCMCMILDSEKLNPQYNQNSVVLRLLLF